MTPPQLADYRRALAECAARDTLIAEREREIALLVATRDFLLTALGQALRDVEALQATAQRTQTATLRAAVARSEEFRPALHLVRPE